MVNTRITKTDGDYDFLLSKITLLEKVIDNVSTKLKAVEKEVKQKDRDILKLKKNNSKLSYQLEKLEIDLTNLPVRKEGVYRNHEYK